MGIVTEQLRLNDPSTQACIPVLLKRSPNRKTWSLSISPGGSVELSVPFLMQQEKIESLLTKHSSWIFKRFKKLSKLKPINLNQKWQSGEEIYFRGQNLTLKLERSDDLKIEKNDPSLVLFANDFRATCVKKNLEDWFIDETYKQSHHFLQKWSPRFGLLDIPRYKLRALKRSWGQCRSDKVITLHHFLSRLHPDFFEYVVVHELCHLFHMNHGPNFKALLSYHLPNWREIKKQHECILF